MPALPAPDSKPVVLVVDDEPLIRMNIADAIDTAGLQVLEACDADEALHLLETQPRIDILLSDVRMPGSMDGAALAKVALSRWPSLRVLVMSGHAAGSGLADGVTFLPKPFPLPVLIDQLGKFTERPQAMASLRR